MRNAVRARLAASPSTLLPAWAIVMSFTTYFCMYAFRKPFSAATYEGGEALGIDIKTVFVISQIIGYCLSKYLGTKLCAEVPRNRRYLYLLSAIVFAEFALFLFAVLPPHLKIVAIFFNGLPLGMVWGFVVGYLEGRRTSELQLAGLSCSYIIASGVVKDVGRWQLDTLNIPEYWMPFTTGAMFFPILFVSATLLNWMPEPNEGDIDERVLRKPMSGKERMAFAMRFALGLSLLLIVYFALTAFRDIRDTYGVEIFGALGYGESPAIFTRSEVLVAFGVMACLVPITWIHDNRKALMAVFGLLVFGSVVIGVSTLMFQREMIGGLTWMILIGFGAYIAYVPYGSVLFDRVVAATRVSGTAVFAIYLTDAFGYTGSVFFQLYKVIQEPDISWLQFFTGFCYLMAIGGGVLLAISYFDFARVAKRAEAEEKQRLQSLQTAEEIGTA